MIHTNCMDKEKFLINNVTCFSEHASLLKNIYLIFESILFE